MPYPYNTNQSDWFSRILSDSGMSQDTSSIVGQLISNGLIGAKMGNEYGNPMAGAIAGGLIGTMGNNGGSSPMPVNDQSPYQSTNPFQNYYQNTMQNQQLAQSAGTDLGQISQNSSPVMQPSAASAYNSGDSGLISGFGGAGSGGGSSDSMSGLGSLLGGGGSSESDSTSIPGSGVDGYMQVLQGILGSGKKEKKQPEFMKVSSPSYGRISYNPMPFNRRVGMI